MIEGLQNSSWMAQMDQILKQIGTEKAAEHFKVSIYKYHINIQISYTYTAIKYMFRASQCINMDFTIR